MLALSFSSLDFAVTNRVLFNNGSGRNQTNICGAVAGDEDERMSDDDQCNDNEVCIDDGGGLDSDVDNDNNKDPEDTDSGVEDEFGDSDNVSKEAGKNVTELSKGMDGGNARDADDNEEDVANNKVRLFIAIIELPVMR